jgi:enoyl-CoA hydratase
MTFQTIELSHDTEHAGVRIITLNRPPVNAMTLVMARELGEVFRSFHEDSAVRAVILTGAGERVFCAGADVKEINERTTQMAIDRSVVFRATFDAIRQAPVPTIAAVNGKAVGAGLVVASCCDIVLAQEQAEFSLPEVLVGVMGGARHAARFMTDKLVRYLAFTGEWVGAQELKSLGHVREVLPLAQLMPRARELACRIAQHSPSAVRLMKEAINLTEDMPLNQGYRVEQLFTTLATSLPDAKDASKAFLQKRST